MHICPCVGTVVGRHTRTPPVELQLTALIARSRDSECENPRSSIPAMPNIRTFPAVSLVFVPEMDYSDISDSDMMTCCIYIIYDCILYISTECKCQQMTSSRLLICLLNLQAAGSARELRSSLRCLDDRCGFRSQFPGHARGINRRPRRRLPWQRTRAACTFAAVAFLM